MTVIEKIFCNFSVFHSRHFLWNLLKDRLTSSGIVQSVGCPAKFRCSRRSNMSDQLKKFQTRQLKNWKWKHTRSVKTCQCSQPEPTKLQNQYYKNYCQFYYVIFLSIYSTKYYLKTKSKKWNSKNLILLFTYSVAAGFYWDYQASQYFYKINVSWKTYNILAMTKLIICG